MTQDVMTVREAIDLVESAYVIGYTKLSDYRAHNDEYTLEELQPADYWVGGDDDGTYTSDSNVNFENPESFERYLKREYIVYFVFDDESERDEWLEQKCEDTVPFVITYDYENKSERVIWDGVSEKPASTLADFYSTFDDRDRAKISNVKVYSLVEVK